MGRSTQPARAIMNTSVVLLLCSVVGSTLGYYVQREAAYNTGPNDPYPIEVSPYQLQEQSQRLFWGNSGSNQVGGTGWWAMLTNKFPFLNSMFGRMELPSQYGVPNEPQTYYGVPNQPLSTQYGVPARIQAQFYKSVPYYQQQSNQFRPSARDVGLTDDAVIITPPQVPIQPAPAPAPVPVPSPGPAHGYQYNIPQQRLELPHK
ncbi:unnamed protein product [Diatraea saccharalis]|uniref:Uncharacterized protein n=1 Tax=Diatraea saccharalis TaxID=40085 RepID=A0A9P0C7P5_9NEOP|nr:unnamed protein product [Diatraea saccharalis]